jgi:signal transduction histidine kinase
MIAETLTNGVEVGGPLKRLQTALVLEIKDDGVGFDASAHRRKPLANTLGLRSMEERAMLAGGRLTIRSAPSQGTNIRVQFPLGTMETRLPWTPFAC